jgi:hypothetical protein
MNRPTEAEPPSVSVANSFLDIFDDLLIPRFTDSVYVQGIEIHHPERQEDQDYKWVRTEATTVHEEVNRQFSTVILYDRTAERAHFLGEMDRKTSEKLAALGPQGILEHLAQ